MLFRSIAPPFLPTRANVFQVDQTLAKASFVSELPGASVSSHDVRKLRGSQWLNDEVITFYAILINARSKSLQAGTPEERKGFKDVYSFTSFFYAKFTEKPRDGSKWTVDKGYQGVQRWTKKVPCFPRFVACAWEADEGCRSTCLRRTS